MPFAKGNTLGKNQGRKGYKIEEEQMKRMKTLLNKGLTLAEVVQSGKANDNQAVALQRTERIMSKVMDKLFANMQKVEHSGDVGLEARINLDKETQELLNEFIEFKKKTV